MSASAALVLTALADDLTLCAVGYALDHRPHCSVSKYFICTATPAILGTESVVVLK